MIAERLGKYAHEVAEELTITDLSEYLAYWKIVATEEKKAAKKNQSTGTGSRTPTRRRARRR